MESPPSRHVFGLCHDGIGVVALVRDHSFSPLSLQKLGSRRIFAGLSWGDAELQR
jgi:hypothetical protein